MDVNFLLIFIKIDILFFKINVIYFIWRAGPSIIVTKSKIKKKWSILMRFEPGLFT